MGVAGRLSNRGDGLEEAPIWPRWWCALSFPTELLMGHRVPQPEKRGSEMRKGSPLKEGKRGEGMKVGHLWTPRIVLFQPAPCPADLATSFLENELEGLVSFSLLASSSFFLVCLQAINFPGGKYVLRPPVGLVLNWVILGTKIRISLLGRGGGQGFQPGAGDSSSLRVLRESEGGRGAVGGLWKKSGRASQRRGHSH